jgi:diaminohydroxyphosphoribosylaminopyrimidine deaminase/5-amino-6-(5-phosphoribosylamino)uracil reductase
MVDHPLRPDDGQPPSSEFDRQCMRRALELAAQGRGLVEPNPMVGCVIARDGQVLGEGWHERFGGPHAEVGALCRAGEAAQGATAYVTLEPCCHHGKTPPCTHALLRAGIQRVVVAQQDPFPQVAGRGLLELREAGLEVDVGLLGQEARVQLAAYHKRVRTGRPWVIAKWAMTLDGKIATHTGHSQWISNERSRRAVHDLRGWMDAIIVGSGTVLTDDPLLTARPAGPRTARRVVLDSRLRTPLDSRLARTAREIPVLIVTTSASTPGRRKELTRLGCEILVCDGPDEIQRWRTLLDCLGEQKMTNVLVEGGSNVLGCLLDSREIDEVHVFIAPRIIGGAGAPSPLAGHGVARIQEGLQLEHAGWEQLDGDLHVWGHIVHPPAA